jgi:threonylcarbamoyladenosine tRNA methylthiotransferase MtaB
MKYSIVTFGCRVNQADSFDLEAQLLAHGGAPSSPGDADVVVVNTCSVTSAADQGARQIVRKIARENPHARIILTGCYATRSAGELQLLPGVVQIVPNERKQTLADEIGLTTAERFGDGDGGCGAAVVPGTGGRTAYTLRVQTGCDEACAYCIIPSTRGRGRSRPIPEVLDEIDRMRDAGYLEIALTGVHLGSYGRDLRPPCSLVDLLRSIEARMTDGVRFRISSLEPMDCTDGIVDLVAGSRCFAPHFHLPLQHASNRMLVAMRRPYTLEYYRRLVDRIRQIIPDASMGSDVIVGFPGETDEDFKVLEQYLAASPLTHIHVFPYSDRPGTAAAAMAGKVHGSIVRERATRLRDIGRRLTTEFQAGQNGRIRSGLTIEDGSLVVTDNYLKVRIEPGRRRNEWLQVRVSVVGDQLIGDVVENGV